MKERHFLSKNVWLTRIVLFPLIIVLLTMLQILPAYASGDSVCAEVKIEISQELTLERQAFDAHMRINNGISHITLEGVDIDVSFSDEDGNTVHASFDPDDTDALFFIRLDSLENIDDIDGGGRVDPSSSADIHWLIIPAPGACNGVPQGTLYYVGATLTYTIGGEEHITDVTPDYIFVKPMPELSLDYFIPSEVFGDDAFTTEIEEPVPFTLGVRVANNGTGTAHDIKINSAQPKITENEQGLLIGFVIEDCEVNGVQASNSLLADFGDIDPNNAAMARWIMTCTLSGQFVEFTADYTHSDELGGELTSLLEDVETHFLVRDVLVDVAGRDSVCDFFAKDGDVFRVYESENTDTEVTDQSDSSFMAISGNHYALTTSALAGFLYVKLPDPYGGTKILEKAIRSDGKKVKEENVWLSKERDGEGWLYYINLFDSGSTGAYDIYFVEEPVTNQPPVLQFITDRSVPEGEQVSFIVEASDPDGTIPSISAEAIPALASFIDNGDGTAIFDWTPASGQAGQYNILFTAFDGLLEDTQTMKITVNTNDDTDGDGLPDDWELDYFGSLDRDGTGDYDGDGISDFDEFLNGTDPTQGNEAPSMPIIQSPADTFEITVLTPDLVIQNSIDPDGDQITYTFEIYSDSGFTSMISGEIIPEGCEGTTSWTEPSELNDNTWYYWRVRADDGIGFSLWIYGSFFVNTANDPPGGFWISSPVDEIEVDSLNPILEVTNSTDADEDSLSYVFYVYGDMAMTNLITVSPPVQEGNGTTSWTVDSSLNNGADYYWEVEVMDEHGSGAASNPASFHVNTINTSPDNPVIISPDSGIEINAQETDLVIQNSSDADGDNLTYFFELDTFGTFDGPGRIVSDEIAEGADTTSWHISGLEDNTLYFWRVRADDESASSSWTTGSFFVNTGNDTPAVPSIRNPGDSAWVDTLTPELALHISHDPDNDEVTYLFQIYSDMSLDNLIGQGETDALNWTVPTSLDDSSRYFWRAQAIDEHGSASAWTEVTDFFVKDDGENDSPAITLQEPSEDILTNSSVTIIWVDSDPDSNSDIALYYDTDNQGEDGILITNGLKEDPDGSGDTYLWDTTGLADGTYYIYGVITDGNFSDTGYTQGAITIDRTPPVVNASPSEGMYSATQSVVLSADEPAQIYYTIDNSEPTTASPPYTTPLSIEDDTTLKVMGVDTIGNQGSVVTEIYIMDRDEDGMADSWEMSYFGNLDRDGTGDLDNDGLSDLDEYLTGEDPTLSNAPTVPVITSPEENSEVTVLQPDLVIQNSVDPDDDAITYIFGIYSDQGMTNLVFGQDDVEEGFGSTSWNVPISLSDNMWHYWRVRATDNIGFSEWAYGSFFVNTANDPPGPFQISNPQNETEVDNLTPALDVTNSTDVDEDLITYGFEVYEDQSMSFLVASAAGITEGTEGTTSWSLTQSLDDNFWYYWKAIATDEHGATTESTLTSFFVNTANDAPSTPVISSPLVGSEVTIQSMDLIVINSTDLDWWDSLSYLFEIDKVNTFDSPAWQSSGEIYEGIDTTSWFVENLDDNSRYYWRAKANDGYAESPWDVGEFFVNTANDNPSEPTLKNPGDSAWVDSLSPTLQLNASQDVDEDQIYYYFEVYAGGSLTQQVAEGQSATPEWVVSPELQDNVWYYWSAQAEDEHGAASQWMDTASFFTDSNGINDPPTIVLEEPSQDITIDAGDVQISWEDADPETDADIALYYDTDNLGEDGSLIIDGLKENLDVENDAYAWDINNIEEGTHYVYGTITDGNSFDASYAPGSVTIARPPTVEIAIPQPDVAVQDGIAFQATADDDSGIAHVYFYLREDDGANGTPIGYEDIVAAFNSDSGSWEFDFDTTTIPDGYYLFLAKAIDIFGNESTIELVPFSIRNWAVVELLPASENNKAGRTMPVKFSLMIAYEVDPAQPFVYSEELEIRIYTYDPVTGDLIELQQTSLFGNTSTDYRIDQTGELYITNFKTMKDPATYLVEVWRIRNGFLLDTFTFETNK